MNLRFIERDGKRILQFRERDTLWQDVPLEELKPEDPKWYTAYVVPCEQGRKFVQWKPSPRKNTVGDILLVDSRPVKALVDSLQLGGEFSHIPYDGIAYALKQVEQLLEGG